MIPLSDTCINTVKRFVCNSIEMNFDKGILEAIEDCNAFYDFEFTKTEIAFLHTKILSEVWL